MSEYTLNDSNLIISGHIVSNEPILPAMGYIHFVAASLLDKRQNNHEISLYPFRVKDAVWFAPLAIAEGACQVNIHLDTDGDDTTYWVTSKVPGKATKRHATGVVFSGLHNEPGLNKKPATNKAEAPVFRLPDTSSHTFTHRLNRDEIYRLFLAGGINYREQFQCLDEFHYSQDLFWGRIVADDVSLTDLPSPYILDAAIQTVLLGARETRRRDHQNQVYVPFSLENMVIHTHLTPKCDVFVVPRQAVSDTPETGVFDVFLANESGEIVVEMKGLHIRSYQRAEQSEQTTEIEPLTDNQPGLGQQNQTGSVAGQSWAIAATFTAEPIAEPLQEWFSRLNWNDQIKFAPYNQVYQELLDQQRLLTANAEGVNAIICRLEDLVANGPITASPITAPLEKNEVPQVSAEQIDHHLTDCERVVLPNGMEVAHLKSYETSYLYEEIFVEKTYVKHGISFEPGDVIVDIGGNIGMFSLFATTQCPDLRIFSCEPSPISYAILRKNLALYAPQAKALQVGLADKDGEAEFVFYPNSSVWSGFHTDETEDGEALKKSMENEVTKRFGDTDSEAIREHLDAMISERLQKQTYQVQMRSLASIMQEHHIETIDLLKVDAEKCEWDILSSIADETWPNIRQVVVEVHDKEGTTAGNIARLLRDKGFELAIVEEEMLKSSGLANFYARRPVAHADNQHRLTPFEQGISDNVKELLTLVRETQGSRRGPTLFVLCPPSPAMRERFSTDLLENIPQMMQQILGDKTDIIGIDLNSESAAYDVTEYHDAVRDEMGHIPYTPAFFEVIASVLVRHIHAFQRPPYKVIALDCDNTLWSGVVGEQGTEGINIDSNYRALQQFMLRQKEQGMLLCLVSKNNHEDVKRVFDHRDDMILQWSDFVDTKINWNAKSDNLQRLAKTLNLGLDSFIFVDDSPIECAEVSAGCPQVLSLRLPEHSDDIPGFLAHVWAFDQVRHQTNEDAKRTDMYQEQVQREAFRQSAFSMEAFIRGLALEITIQPATQDQAERLSQLTHRTNQFNFVKAPYSVADILARIQSPDKGCLSISVADRFGDYGICGLCFFSERENVLSVDGGLLSCRVLGRGVEYQMLNVLGRKALERKKEGVEIRFVASDKNKPAENFLRSIDSIQSVSESSDVWTYTIPATVLAELVFTPSSQTIVSSNENAQSESVTASQQRLPSTDTLLMQQIGDQRGRLPTLRSEPEYEQAERQQTEQETVSQSDNIDEDAILNYINATIVKNVLECLKKKVDIDEAKAFSEYGVDSFAAINLVVKLNGAFAIKLPSTVLFDYGCVNDLRCYLMENYRNAIVTRMQSERRDIDIQDNAAQRSEANQTRKTLQKTDDTNKTARHIDDDDIAVIGMSARFPGVVNVDAFWSLLLDGGNCISEVPASRWNIAAYFDEDRTKPNKTYGRWGGFIEDIDKFDASFFGISGKEAKQMDPQQRLFLQESWHALEDAGYANREIKDKKWAVYAGADAGDYQANLRQHDIPLDASSFMGNDASILAARIAYFMDMKGPAMAIDTASSSSLAAVHLACESLRNGAVDMAIAGGVSIHTTANFHILCAKAGMLSADGRCKPFDHRADGFVPGEAVGVVILKRLQDAIDDKDHIYSVIKGSAMNQDGKTNGITAPSSRSQTELICQVYDALNLSADELTYIEAHGTGTTLGDPIEITGLTDAFRRQTQRTGFCAIGSVKSNIGHCVHASGVSALIKLLLSFKHRKLAPSVNYEKPNPLIPFEDTPFVVNTQVQDWQPNSQGKRIAAVSSFGFSGTNVHMVLEEFLPADVSPANLSSANLSSANLSPELGPEPALLLLSAKSEAQLHVLARQLKAYIQQRPHLTAGELKDMAYTLQLGRESLGHRLAVAGKSDAEILTGLDDYLNRNTFALSYLSGTVAQGEKNKGNNRQQQADIDASIQRRDLRGLAGQWLEGRQIDWAAWYQTARQRVAGLPLYPFEQDRYWLPEDDDYSTPDPLNGPATRSPAVMSAGAELSASDVADSQKIGERAQGKRVLTSLQTFQVAAPFQVSNLNAENSSFRLTDEGQGIFCLRLHGADGGLPAEDSPGMSRLSDLHRLFTEIKNRTDIRVLLLSGDEHRFLPALEDDAELFLQKALYRAVLALPFPVIASVPGDCKGYAWLFVCLCDFAVLSTTGRYQYVSREQLVSQQLYHLLSERFTPSAAQVLLTGQGIEGRHLKELGLLMPVFPSAEVTGESLKLAQELAGVPREALIQLKQHLAANLVRQSAALTAQPVAFALKSAISESNESALLTENGLQAFEAGQLGLPLGKPRKVVLNSPVIDVEVYDNGVLLVRLCERESRNKFSKAFVAGFEEIFAHIHQNQAYKVVVLTGYDHYFASGGTMETLQAIQQGNAKFTDEKIFALPLECDIPVIAAMQGHGIGPGWAVGMFCDDAIFSQESVYYSPYMRYGFTPGAGSTLILPCRLGLDIAREVLFTAKEYKGFELQARGLKNPVLERAQVLPFALAAANALARMSRDELVARKTQRSQHIRNQVEANYALELRMHEHTFVGNQEVLARIQQHFNQGMSSRQAQVSDQEQASHQKSSEVQGVKTPGSTSAVQKEQDSNAVFEQVYTLLRRMLAEELQIRTEQIESEQPFVDLGLDSITGVTWIRKINAEYGLTLNAADVYSYPSLKVFTGLVIKEAGLNTATDKRRETRREIGAETTSGAVPAAVGLSNVTVGGGNVREHAVDSRKRANILPVSILEFLSQTLSQELQIKPQAIDPNVAFVDLGLDSITGVTWIRKINQHYGLDLNAAEVYSYPTLQEFAVLVQRCSEPGQSPLPDSDVFSEATLTLPTVSDTGAEFMAGRHQTSIPSAKPALLTEERAEPQAAAATRAENTESAISPAPAGRQAIAIVGMSGQFPKAKNLQQFWENLSKGEDCISEIPADRWAIEDFFDRNRQTPGKTNSKWMGVLEDADKFDPLFFNISPREAEMMDPQQRVFLEACWGCIEDAGYNPADLSGRRCGVFVGCGAGDYDARFGMELNAQAFMGNAISILAARIAYHLDLQGPSLAIDTACSSSLVAIASACDSLVLGNSDLALAGGVSVLAGPSMHIMTSKAGMLSEDGRCFTFDQRANGFVPGEGVGVVLLKRLEDAIADQDVIHGVIKGWGVNQDGKSNGITAPNGNAQSRLEQAVYTGFGIDPEQIQYVETHGTGTKLGDPVEVVGLKQTFAQFTRKENYCALGSVKSNIGHTLRAAGVASVLKVLLAMKNQQLPPTLHHQELNEHITLDGTPFYVNRELSDWTVESGQRRQAAVSSFGFSGTNAHVVIEQFPTEDPSAMQPSAREISAGEYVSRDPALILLSAKNDAQLKQMTANLLAHVRGYAERIQAKGDSAGYTNSAGQAQAYLHSLAYTLQTGREAMNERLGLVAHTLDELQRKLSAVLAGERQTVDLLYQGKSKSHRDALSVFDVDEDMHDLVQAWASKGKFGKLLEIWVKGINIDWEILYSSVTPSSRPKRVSLPTYPFARERYWVDLPTTPTERFRKASEGAVFPSDTTLAPDSTVSASVADHPAFSHRTGGGAEETAGVFQQAEPVQALLNIPGDFSAYGNMMAAGVIAAQGQLPGLLLLELARHAWELATQENTVELNYILWGQPARMQDALNGHIQTYISREDDGFYFQCVTEKAGESVTHNFGQIALNAAVVGGGDTLDIRALETQLDAPHNHQITHQIRQIFDEDSLKNQALIEKVGFDGKQLLVTFNSLAELPHQLNAPTFRPVLLTTCWQLLCALNHYCHPQATGRSPWYPFSLDSIIARKPITERVTVYLSPTPVAQESLIITGDLPGYDLRLYDESGELCLWLRNLKMVKEEALLRLEPSDA
ncbi:FkbM family methyltransferase [Dickeya dianthicola]|uniref:FkbM family methyltransferase n=1 Tax=Dickeya dianthicola TaxID=204039 RepID=UPI001F60DAB4|nr:FkbM family methyltransferase [Dickeya dianthicola]MCI4193231.1 FkbM family methyltransferase [Dickeya dianthicola]MCI4201322.1 FkbM family methyltransferase [Dickeya dianthicola]